MTNKEYFDQIINRNSTDCYKWDYNQEFFNTENLLPMWVADMDFRSPPEIIDALKKRAEHGIFGYTFHSEKYYNSIINWQLRRHNWKIEKEWIINIPGVVPGINFAIQTFTEPGDRILFLTPVYDPFFHSIDKNIRIPVNSDLKIVDNHYEIDFDDLEEKSKDAKILLFCSPHNPVGRVWLWSELQMIADICLKNNVMIFSDEIHSDLVFRQNNHIPIARLSLEVSDITIIFNAPSKTFNIAGLSTSYAVIPNKKLRKTYQSAIDKNWLNSGNIFGMLALETAYSKGEMWLNKLLIYLEDNYEYLRNFLSKEIPLILPVRMEGTYLAWLDCRKLDLGQKKLFDLFSKKAGVGLMSGERYGSAGKGFMRLNFGCPRKILKDALEKIRSALIDR